MKDLTKGKPSTLILAFALPIFLGNLLQLTYSVTDTRIVGSFLGEDALAAVGATTTLSNLIIGFLLGLANGFAIITAQRFGAKDIRGVKKSFAASLVLGTVISVVLTVLGLVFLQPILRFLNVPEHLIPVAGPYIFIIIAGLLATFLYDACAAALRAPRGYRHAARDSGSVGGVKYRGRSSVRAGVKGGCARSCRRHGFCTDSGVCDLLDLHAKTV